MLFQGMMSTDLSTQVISLRGFRRLLSVQGTKLELSFLMLFHILYFFHHHYRHLHYNCYFIEENPPVSQCIEIGAISGIFIINFFLFNVIIVD